MTNMQDDAFWDTPVQEPLAPRAGRRTRGSRAATKVERVETRGRARALQALYAADLRDLTQLRKIATHVFDDLAVDPEELRARTPSTGCAPPCRRCPSSRSPTDRLRRQPVFRSTSADRPR